MNHRIQWQTASPLWSEALKDSNNTRFRQPAVLRFASDTFMEDLQATLDDKPAELKNYVLRPETWRAPDAGWLAGGATSVTSGVPKLYHPAHKRFYLATANLVCGLPGLPDKKVDATEAEKTSFVLRRLVAKNGSASAGYDEQGWLAGKGWKALGEPGQVLKTEERMPMFAMSFCDNGRCRRMLAGFVPVSSRESYQAGPEFNPFDISEGDLVNDPLADSRLALFAATVGEGMAELYGALKSSSAAKILDGVQAQEVFLFTLLDFAQFIQDNLARNYTAIAGLNSAILHSDTGLTWAEALAAVGLEERIKAILDGELKTLNFIIPGFSSQPAADIRQALENAIANLGIVSLSASPGRYQLSEGYRGKVKTALDDFPPEEKGEDGEAGYPSSDQLGKFDAQAGALYAIRCVYDRPQCVGSARSIVSERSQFFQLAPFFDPDAPARPIRIAMPVDTSIEGLRKAPKAVSFLISDQLRNQIDRVQGVTLSSLEDGELGEEGEWTLGMICTLSIPIITICALILLMIIVFMLNIIFWWLPFFKICLPIPIKAK